MSRKNVEKAIQSRWHTAPVDIQGIIEDSGISLNETAALDPKVSGELRRLDNGGYRISVNRVEHAYRRRFTMAHELAHFYLHASLVGKGTDDNKVYMSTSDGAFYNQNIEKKHEYEANSFAIFILMPKHLIDRWIDENGAGVPLNATCISGLAEHLQVSVKALEIRLDNLGIARQS